MAAKAKPKPEPRKSRLKVFRTAIGFHDAYVAAASRKAALAAWGTDKDLFARGVAEEVTDPALTAEPLSAPGTVFRQLRSAPADLASPPRKTRKAKSVDEAVPPRRMQRTVRSAPPRPSEDEVAEARSALARARREHEIEERDLAARERELANRRRSMESRQAKELGSLVAKLAAAEEDYGARLAAWENEAGERR